MSALKKNREEQGGVYVGVWVSPTSPHIPGLLSQLTFFSGFINTQKGTHPIDLNLAGWISYRPCLNRTMKHTSMVADPEIHPSCCVVPMSHGLRAQYNSKGVSFTLFMAIHQMKTGLTPVRGKES
jgi:hypothetical protein